MSEPLPDALFDPTGGDLPETGPLIADQAPDPPQTPADLGRDDEPEGEVVGGE